MSERQPARRGRSWQISINNARSAIEKHLRDNPSLKSKLGETFADAYETARGDAAVEIDEPLETFTRDCPWTFEQAMREEA